MTQISKAKRMWDDSFKDDKKDNHHVTWSGALFPGLGARIFLC